LTRSRCGDPHSAAKIILLDQAKTGGNQGCREATAPASLSERIRSSNASGRGVQLPEEQASRDYLEALQAKIRGGTDDRLQRELRVPVRTNSPNVMLGNPLAVNPAQAHTIWHFLVVLLLFTKHDAYRLPVCACRYVLIYRAFNHQRLGRVRRDVSTTLILEM